jgi:UDP-glucose 4-epimerase
MPHRDACVLVTGAAGFLGQHVARRLAEAGIQVVGGVRRPSPNGVRSILLDVTDRAQVEAALRSARPTHIINCAAYGTDQSQQSYPDAFAVNVEACANLVKASARAAVRRFVHVGTCSEYASSDFPIREDAPQRPHNLYAISKAAGTSLALELGEKLGLDVAVVRPFGLWGPGEPSFRIVPQIIATCREKLPLALTDCDLVRDYSFVADAAGWINKVTFSEAIKPGTIVNIGSGRAVLLRDFVLTFAAQLGGSELMEFGKRPQRPNEPKNVVADVSRLVSLIGSLKHTSLEDGLRQMLQANRP